MTSSDICQIIEACCKYGVARFKYGALKVVFASKPIDIENSASAPQKTGETVSETALVQSEEDIKKETEQKELSQADDEVADLLISDPLAFEEALAAGELVDVDKGELGRGPQ